MPLPAEDPCALYTRLREAYLRILEGVQESEVEYMGNGVTRRVRFTQTNLAELRAEMDRAQALCETGQSRRRFAITAGIRPQRWP